jgi:Cof subfamily protein (haloacid dehalogenase superfamily)
VEIRLIAADLDGTLLRGDGSISPRTRQALDRAAAAGIAVLLVTARPPRHVRAMTAGLDLEAAAICSNGALVYDLGSDLVLEQTRLPAALANELVIRLRERLPDLCFAVEAGLRFGQEPAFARHIRAYRETEPPRYAEASILCAEGVTKLIALHPRIARDELLAIARELIADRAEVTHSGADIVEIAAAGVTKAWALARYCAARGVARETVIAFGDMPNDTPMLEWAGHGVAVANAHPEVLAIAREHAPSNEEDGVAIVLERLLDQISTSSRCSS